MTSIKVAIKVRPLIPREIENGSTIQWTTMDNTIFPTDRRENTYQFDHIFGTESSNQQVFDTVVQPIIEAAVNGFNGTIFAYGQTSSGKTYTMMGSKDCPGILVLAIRKIFSSIESTSGREFLLRVGYIEIYNEKVNDLLDKQNTDFKLREENGDVVVKCKEEIVTSEEMVLKILKSGDKSRRIGKTDMNEYSSRSHSIFRITIESKQTDSDSDGAVQVSQLNLVDLAGSERAEATTGNENRFKEGRFINLSLTKLGMVIMQLSENQEYVNFRDSKLTRILQASLGGNAMTAIICAATPASLDETMNTLNFASRAKSIKNKPKLNEVMSDAALLKRYKKQIDMLTRELQNTDGKKNVDEVEKKLQETLMKNQNLNERINMLQRNILSSSNLNQPISDKKRRQTWAAPAARTALILSPIFKRPSNNCNLETLAEEDSDEIPLSDFEMALYDSYQNIQLDDEEDQKFIKRNKKVSFDPKDDVTCYYAEESMTSSGCQYPQSSPGTPKSVLREKIMYMSEELKGLQEITRLEKVLIAEDESREEFVQLKHQMRCLRKENENLQSSVCDKERSMEKLTKLHEELKKSHEEMQKKLTKNENMEKKIEDFKLGLKVYQEDTKRNKRVHAIISSLLNGDEKKIEIGEKDQAELRLLLSNEKLDFDVINKEDKCDEEKEELRKKLKVTEEQLSDFKSKMSEYQGKLNEMEKSKQQLIDKKDKELNELKLQIDTLEVENNAMMEKMNQMGKMRREKEDLMTKCQVLEKVNQSLEGQAEELEKLQLENQKLQEQLTKVSVNSDLQQEIKLKCDEIESLQRENAQLKEELAKFLQVDNKVKSEAYEETICKIKQEKDDLNKSLKQSMDECEELKLKIKSLDLKLKDYQNQVGAMNVFEKEVEELKEKVLQTENRVQALESENLSLKETNSKMEETNSRLKELLKVEQETSQKLSSNLSKQESELTKLESKLEEHKLKEKNLFDQIQGLEDYKTKYSKLEKEMKNVECEICANKELNDSNEKIINLQELLKKEKENYNELKMKFEKEQKNSQNYASLEQTLQEEKSKFSEMMEHHNFENSKIVTLLNEKIIEFNNLQKQCTELQEQADLNLKNSEEHHRRAEELDEQVRKQNSEIEELYFEKEKINSETEKLSFENEELNFEKDKLHSEIESLNFEFEKLNSDKEILHSEVQKLNSEIQNLNSVIETEKQKIKDEEQKYEDLRQQFEKQKQDSKSLLEQFQEEKKILLNQIKEFAEKSQDYQDKCKSLEDEANLIQKQLQERDEIIKRLSSENNHSLRHENCDLMGTQYLDLTNKSKIVRDLDSPMISLQTRESLQKSSKSLNSSSIVNNEIYFDNTSMLDETVSDADSTIDKTTLINDNKKLRVQLQAKIQETKDIDNMVGEFKEGIKRLKQTIIVLTSENSELTEKLSQQKAQFDETKNSMQTKIDELQTQSFKLTYNEDPNATQLDNKQISNDIVDYEQKLSDLKTEKEHLFAELEEMRSKNKKELQKSEERLQKMTAAIESEMSKNSELSAQLLQKTEEISSLKHQINSLKEENGLQIADLEAQMIKLRKENDQLSTEIMDLVEGAELLQKTDEINSLKQQLSLIQEESSLKIAELESVIVKLRKENDQLAIDLMNNLEELEKSEKLKESSNKIVLQVKTLEDQILGLIAENKNLMTENINLVSENENLIAENKKLTTENENLSAEGKKLNRSSKAGIKNVNRQLEDLQKHFEQEVNETGPLLSKANEPLDESLLMDQSLMMNDSLNVSLIQEKVQHIDKEFDELKNIHRELSISFQQKCEEIEKLQLVIASAFSKGQKKNKIDKLNRDLDTIKNDLKNYSSNFANIKSALDKCAEKNDATKQEIDLVKSENKQLRETMSVIGEKSNQLEQKIQVITDENTKLKNLEAELRINESDLQAVIEELKSENANFINLVSTLQKSLKETKELEESLTVKLNALKEEKNKLIEDSKKQIEDTRKQFSDISKNLTDQIEENKLMKKSIDDSNKSLTAQMKENNELKNQIIKLQNQSPKSKMSPLSAKKELDNGRRCIVKEIKSLDPKAKISSDKTISELMAKLLETIMTKEAVIIQELQEKIKAGKEKLQEEKRERTEAEKKANEWMRTLEADNDKLQAELTDLENKNKQILRTSEIVKNLTQERDECSRQVEKLNSEAEELKSKNRDLLMSIESLENNGKQLSNENKNLDNEIANVKNQIRELYEAYSNLNSELAEKNSEIESMNARLNEECERYSQYKQTLESLQPEYNSMQEQIREYKSNIDTYKTEIETLTSTLQNAELNSSVFKKQFEDQQNKYCILEEKYAQMEVENSKLARKIRNSASKSVIEELEDKNHSLENKLEGVSNRMLEIQTQTSEQIKQLQQKITSYEKIFEDEDNCDVITALKKEVFDLTSKFKELDAENEELAKMINSLEDENSILQLKVTELKEGNGSEELKSRLSAAEAKIAEYELEMKNLADKLMRAEVQMSLAEKNANCFSSKNRDLQTKISSLEDRLETMSASSTRSNSPAFEIGNEMRRQRRSNQFNQNRKITENLLNCECSFTCLDDPSCACSGLRQKIRTLELEVVDKDCKISTLELTIKSESFPFQEKCKQLKKTVTAYQEKISELQSRNLKLERMSSQECEACKRRKTNKRDQAIQFPEKMICLGSVQSGIIEEDSMVKKLEKERDFMRQVCRERKRKNLELEAKLKAYFDMYGEIFENNVTKHSE